jgi:hypothetical protein
MKRPRTDFESPNRSRDSRPHASGYESDTRSYKTYDSKRSNYREDRNKRRSKGTHRPSSRNQHPPTSEEVKNWYKQGGTCLFCGDKKHHRKFVNCPIRNAYHPDWTPDWAALTDKHRHAEAYAMQTNQGQKSPHKYPHMGEGDNGRGRTRERERDRDLSREPRRERSESRNPRPAASGQANLPGPPPLQPRQGNQ